MFPNVAQPTASSPVYPIGETLPPPPTTTTATTPTPAPNSLPTKLTLTVNKTTAIATTTANSVHITGPKVAPSSDLEIKATLDQPLPAGWTMVVFDNGDKRQLPRPFGFGRSAARVRSYSGGPLGSAVNAWA